MSSAEWLRGDPRRTALGLDIDEQALSWGIRENFASLPGSARGRACMLLGDVRDPLTSARFACPEVLDGQEGDEQSAAEGGVAGAGKDGAEVSCISTQSTGAPSAAAGPVWPQLEKLRRQRADLICAFNFSSCCLLHRSELLAYFRSARARLAGGGTGGESVADGGAGSGAVRGGGGGGGGGGVFAMDLYGGTSSEGALKLHRRYGDMDYTWEQERFDAVTRTTRISLHFRVPHDWVPASSAPDSTRRGGRKRQQPKRVLRSAFSYSWRLWTIPEVRELMQEAGFDSVHVWMRKMPDLADREDEEEEVEMDEHAAFEEVETFLQTDSWNAYVVGVVKPRRGKMKEVHS
ncbi:hypothetical protein CLOM_g22108 [Closterium sp. NIES-68]|nr:hypothetical protein CLOM_g22108 [Closterium sp. NIES-68]GJP74454.1 hypothetical protein CLOP_g5031 [Closterium sp. NIES-67]